MKTIRNLILSSASGLVALGGAQAADLPVKAKAVEYVRICSLYGEGFFFIPGTDTCIKIGGYLRVDTTFNGGVYGVPNWNGDPGQQNRFSDSFVSRSRMALTIDTRTETEDGVVRTFGEGRFQFNNFGSSNPSTLSAFPGGAANALNTAGGGYVAVAYLFIQFAGFTFGKSASAYATPWQQFPGNVTSNLLGGQNTDTGVNNIQYTAEFGNGVSASIGLDDPTVWDRTAVYNLSIPSAIGANGTGSNAYAGTHAPTSSATFGSIRLGVCSSSRLRRTKSAAPTTYWAPAPCRPRFPKSACQSALKFDPVLECAPGAGQVEVSDLTGVLGFRKMKAMARQQRSHSIEFKRQVVQEYIAGETLYGLAKRHDLSRQLIRVWVEKYEAGGLDADAQAADLLHEYETKIVALERMVGRQALEIEFLKGALKNAPRPRSATTSVIAGPTASPSQKDAG